MRVKEGFSLRQIGSMYLIVETRGEGMRIVCSLNETGAFLWPFLARGISRQRLLDEMISEYDVDEDTAREDMDNFLGSLQAEGILEVE